MRLTKLMGYWASLSLSLIATALFAAGPCACGGVDVDAAAGGSQEQRISALLDQLTLQDKVYLLSGSTSFGTASIGRLGIRSMSFSDGPYGVRSNDDRAATVFPVGLALAATWDGAMLYRVGQAIGAEAHAMDVQVLLGPNLNLVRSPLAGRNFETYGEDPLLAGRMGVDFVRGVQSIGVGAAPKHFVGNEQETERGTSSSEIDERTLRELYLAPFEMTVREAKPWALMTAYNRVNGVFMSEHEYLLKKVLKDEWGFDGIVMSDWGATHSFASVSNGMDLEMPGPPRVLGESLLNAVNYGEVRTAAIENAAQRMLRLYARTGHLERQPHAPAADTGSAPAATARAAAAEAITLLKNEHDALPLDASKLKRIAVIGPNADTAIIQGGGSSQVQTSAVLTPLQAIRSLLATTAARIDYESGVDNEPLPPMLDPRYVSPTKARRQPGLQTRYYGNEAWRGRAIQSRIETSIGGLNVGRDVAVQSDSRMSARWMGYFFPPIGGDYEFAIEYLDVVRSTGILPADTKLNARILLDGKEIVGPQTAVAHTVAIKFLPTIARTAHVNLQAGHAYPLDIEYSSRGTTFNALRVGVRKPAGTIDAAVQAARAADVAVVFVGSSSTTESEGQDRDSLALFGNQNELVAAVAAANPHTVVVLNNGGPVEMPWLQQVAAVVEAWLPGQEGSHAVADVLFGQVNPSGKLPISFPRRLQDSPSYLFFPGARAAVYGEGIFMGYRYYDKRDVEPLFPFGYGLSYTQFEYSNLQVPKRVQRGEPVEVSVDIKNIGQREGAEVAQLYVADEHCREACPVRELKAFERVALQKGETRTVVFKLEPRAFAHYDTLAADWQIEPGVFEIAVGSGSRDLRQRASLELSHTPASR